MITNAQGFSVVEVVAYFSYFGTVTDCYMPREPYHEKLGFLVFQSWRAHDIVLLRAHTIRGRQVFVCDAEEYSYH